MDMSCSELDFCVWKFVWRKALLGTTSSIVFTKLTQGEFVKALIFCHCRTGHCPCPAHLESDWLLTVSSASWIWLAGILTVSRASWIWLALSSRSSGSTSWTPRSPISLRIATMAGSPYSPTGKFSSPVHKDTKQNANIIRTVLLWEDTSFVGANGGNLNSGSRNNATGGNSVCLC